MFYFGIYKQCVYPVLHVQDYIACQSITMVDQKFPFCGYTQCVDLKISSLIKQFLLHSNCWLWKAICVSGRNTWWKWWFRRVSIESIRINQRCCFHCGLITVFYSGENLGFHYWIEDWYKWDISDNDNVIVLFLDWVCWLHRWAGMTVFSLI